MTSRTADKWKPDPRLMSKRKKGLFEPTPEEETKGETSWTKFKKAVGKDTTVSYTIDGSRK
jgi:hypothetical protein